MSDRTAQTADPTAAAYTGGSAADYIALLKPRVMSLVVFTALAGMALAPADLHPVLALAGLLCIAIGAGASGALNMWYDADIDAVMARTARRPVPQGRIAPGEALGFGLVLACGSVIFLGLFLNWVAAALLAFTIFFYVVIYTMWLKRTTAQNIVIGGAAGAFPPVIGWLAAGAPLTLEPVILFAIIFMWTPPHFWSLALLRGGDYARAGVPMLPVVRGEQATRRQILFYSLLLAPTGALPWLLGYAGTLFGAVSLLAGALFVARAIAVHRDSGETAARQLFGYSILYLFLLFATLLGEHALGFS